MDIVYHNPEKRSEVLSILEAFILFRYLDGDEVSEDDLELIHHDFADKKEVLNELKRMEVQLFSEALDNFYSELWK